MKVEVKKPCEWTCPKCGDADIHRKHCLAGEKQDRCSANRKEFRTPHIDFDYWQATVKLECILHHCRECSFEWTTDVIVIPAEAEDKPKESIKCELCGKNIEIGRCFSYHTCVKCHGRIKLCFDCGVEANREKPFICHSCRKSEKPAEKPVEKTYTREEVAKVLCPMCAMEKTRIYDSRYLDVLHETETPNRLVTCFASDWLKATEKKGGEG